MDQKSKIEYQWTWIYIGILFLIGLVAAIIEGGIQGVIQGFFKIMVASDILITDYIELAGVGATFINVAVVTLISALLMYFNGIPMHGGAFLTIGLMSGFSFFGKNIFNMWFIFGGTYCFCKLKKVKFSKYLIISLLSTALAPLISNTFFTLGPDGNLTIYGVTTSVVCGFLIGFIMPMLAAHTEKLLHGLSLYNGGFAIGLLALIMVPILKSYGFEFTTVNIWAIGYNKEFSILLFTTFFLFILGGYWKDRKNAFKNYWNLLKRPGVPKDDFVDLDGMGAVLINMGVNGIIATSYLLLIGGDLNGPTLGGIFTIVGFGGKGKHARNMIPIMLGVYLGGVTKLWSPTSPAAQLAALFGTTLAPVAGSYGIIAGIIAGFIHSSVVLQAGLGYSGANLYNNGFAGGIVSIVMYSILSTFLKPNTYSQPSESMCCKQLEQEENR